MQISPNVATHKLSERIARDSPPVAKILSRSPFCRRGETGERESQLRYSGRGVGATSTESAALGPLSRPPYARVATATGVRRRARGKCAEGARSGGKCAEITRGGSGRCAGKTRGKAERVAENERRYSPAAAHSRRILPAAGAHLFFFFFSLATASSSLLVHVLLQGHPFVETSSDGRRVGRGESNRGSRRTRRDPPAVPSRGTPLALVTRSQRGGRRGASRRDAFFVSPAPARDPSPLRTATTAEDRAQSLSLPLALLARCYRFETEYPEHNEFSARPVRWKGLRDGRERGRETRGRAVYVCV